MRLIPLLLISLFVIAPAPSALASSAELREAYQAMMKDPSNVTLNERYISKALSINDYEAAIAPLERLAMQDPNNMDYVLRIGEMFRGLESGKAANGYFNKVIGNPNSTPAQVARAKKALGQ